MENVKYLKPDRIAAAIRELADWRLRAKSQPAMHLWPLIALIHGKVDKKSLKQFTEPNEFDFWDEFFRLPGEIRDRRDLVNGQFAQDYYVEPLVLSLKPADYPHRSPWTIRVRTFLASWGAAEADATREHWKLKPNYSEIFVEKVLRRGDDIHRVPVVDLAVWLFRDQEFPAGAISKDLERRFRKDFPFEDVDYDRIFEFTEEDSRNLFTETKPTDDELQEAIEGVLLREDKTPVEPPPLLSPEQKSLIEDDDPVYVQVKDLLDLGTSGIIFRGCPGTSKTWYAKQIAHKLVADPAHVFQSQFHPSYGYEDFVEGYTPDEKAKSGFKVIDKIFLDACRLASGLNTYVVFIIDEINRGDPARVFGELLTYIEHGYRGDKFRKSYTGSEATVPKNIIVFGTMNQYDRSITQFDLALTRRFDHVDLKPSAEKVEEFLEQEGGTFTSEQITRISKWFGILQNLLQTAGGIGHTYFKDVKRPDQLRTVWQYRMLPYCESVLELDKGKLENVKASFEGMYRAVTGHGEAG